MRKCAKLLFLSLVSLIFIGTAGCANMDGFGKFIPDNQARTVFETYRINPDYRYYITGSDTYPVAILALNKSYTMGNDLWKELELTPNRMKEMIAFMQQRLMLCCGQVWSGFEVVDQTGKQIGILYAYFGAGISFKVTKDKEVILYGPRDDDQLKKYEDRQPL